MLERPLEPGYQDAADRRAAAGLPPATTTRSAIVVIMAVLTGFLFAVGAQSLKPRPNAGAAIKAELVTRIQALQQQSAKQEATISALDRQVRDLEALALQQSGQADLTAETKRLEIAAAAVALTGSGLTLTVDDAASADSGGDAAARPSTGFNSGRVASSDLQIIVNGLWGAGAEAISINGHRLTSTAAIRFAGQAIIVDFRPLTRPYVITALGDPRTMQQVFTPSFAGVYLDQLTQQFGIRSNLTTSDHLSVPGGSAERLTVAQPLTSQTRSTSPVTGATSKQLPTKSGSPSAGAVP